MTSRSTCDLLVLSCIDFRMPGHTKAYLDSIGHTGNYDLHTLPGASLGACCDQYPHWQQTFTDIIGLAQNLHSIKKVLIIDHADCGAFHNLVRRPHDDADELDLHQTQAQKTYKWFKSANPDLEIEIVFMALDGKVTPMPHQP